MSDSLLYEHLKNSPIFSMLDPYMFQLIEKRLKFCQLQPGEVLFTEGEHGDSMAFVLVGNVSVIKNNPDGKSVQVGRIGPGDSIGEMALIDSLSRSATIKAEQLTAIVILSKEDFETIINDYPRIGIEMLRGISTMLSIKLRRTSEQLSQLML
jgi:CRP/FNR family transcriptional regulator